MFNPFTFDFTAFFGFSQETEIFLMTLCMFYIPTGLIVLMFFCLMIHITYEVFDHMINGPPVTTPPIRRRREPNGYFEIKKFSEIRWAVEDAERAIGVPVGLPYKDGKKYVPTKDHDHYVSKVTRKRFNEYETEEHHWLERVEYSYFPFTLFTKLWGEPQTSFDYSFPKQIKPKGRWGPWCLRKENRWW